MPPESTDGFTDLEVWRRGCRLCESIYAEYGSISNYAFRDQICKAALSIPSNIAEGYERGSKGDFIRFLRIAKGSCAEIRTQLWISARIGLLGREEREFLVNESVEISRMIEGLIGWLRKSGDDPE